MPSSASPQRVVVVGSSFAGLTAALELRKHLHARHEVVVLDPRELFTFIPSLIWLPFGIRAPEDITFPLAPLYERKGIRYINEAAVRIDTEAHVVTTTSGEALPYDRLLIATGPRLAFEKVPGLGPEAGYTQSVCNLDHALLAQDAWEHFLENPGPSWSEPPRAAPASARRTSSCSTSTTGSRRRVWPTWPRSRSCQPSRTSATSASAVSGTPPRA
jgi:sulfide:quinone oxidoreductase